MKIDLETFFSEKDYDIRKTKDARFMDQKVTPDVVCIVADCVLNFVADRKNISFTKNDIWASDYFNVNVKSIFNKPDASNETLRLEYDKFISQPLKMLSYSGVLSLKKIKGVNIFSIENIEILSFIAMKERNSFIFLYHYLEKVLSDSSLILFFNEFRKKCIDNIVTNQDYIYLRDRFIRFIIGNTSINGAVEVRRIFPKILNVFSCKNGIRGSVRGRLSVNIFYYSDLMYNRSNWRDIIKMKNESRQELKLKENGEESESDFAYSKYLVQKAINIIKKKYTESEIKDTYGTGRATQVHHIFPKTTFPQIAHYLENLIKLTPTQHFIKAHPNNNTQIIDSDYQLICLIAKSLSIEESINLGEFFYSKESFLYVINTGLDISLDNTLNFDEIRLALSNVYNEL